MSSVLSQTSFSFAGQKDFYRGKVRDVYHFDDKIVVIASDRISAFDYVLNQPIPYKGQVLNQLAAYFLNATSDIIPNWLTATPDPNVSVGVSCTPFKVEMVIRGYLAGHAWRLYKQGIRSICGVSMPDGMQEGDAFPEPIITPATKSEEGHDEDISREEIIEKGLVPPHQYVVLEQATKALFTRGMEMARDRGLILVDTKYEFGERNGKIYLIDEVHTPDSSRYYYLDGYEDRQRNGEQQVQLSKEFVREWLMSRGFSGLEGQIMPDMPDFFVEQVSNRYIELFEILTGEPFQKPLQENAEDRVQRNILTLLEENR